MKNLTDKNVKIHQKRIVFLEQNIFFCVVTIYVNKYM